MKNHCCIFIVALILVVIGLQIYTISKISPPPLQNPPVSRLPSLLPTASPTTQPVMTATPAASDTLLVEVNNPAACSFTDTATFSLERDVMVTRIRTWYSWDQAEESIPYTLTSGTKTVSSGQLIRKDCDPYQRQWCIAADFSFNKPLEKGDYTLTVPKKKICQNSASGNKGFIFVWGR